MSIYNEQLGDITLLINTASTHQPSASRRSCYKYVFRSTFGANLRLWCSELDDITVSSFKSRSISTIIRIALERTVDSSSLHNLFGCNA